MAEEAVSSAGYRAGTGEQSKHGIPLLFSSSLALFSIAAGAISSPEQVSLVQIVLSDFLLLHSAKTRS